MPTAETVEDGSPDRLEAYLQRVAPEVLGVTYWFRPPAGARSVTLRMVGRRLEVNGAPGPRDRFIHEETVDGVVAGGGPIAVTARIGDIKPGEWNVNAALVDPARGDRQSPPSGPGGTRVERAAWSWLRWRLRAAPPAPVHTCLKPLAVAPATLLGIWVVFAVAGIAVALVTQAQVISSLHAHLGHVLTVSWLAVAAGIVGAKAWYMVLQRGERRRDGWCIQGLVSGVTLVAVTLLLVNGTPVGTFLDVSAPGLMFGLAIGRLGCLFAGCCTGRPTASRWGVWSSDRRVGIRRIPTQLLESALAATIGLAALLAVLIGSPRHGGVFVSAMGLYTLIRQALLRLRVEPRRSTLVGPLTAIAAATATVAGILTIAVT